MRAHRFLAVGVAVAIIVPAGGAVAARPASPAQIPAQTPAQAAPAAALAAPAKKRAKGRMRIRITGLPSGVRPTVRVTGPRGYRKTVKRTATLNKLTPGRYRVTTAAVSTAAGTATGTPSKRRVKVRAGRTVTVTAAYQWTPTPPPETPPVVPPVSPPAPPPASPPPSSPPPTQPPVDTTPPGPITGLAVTDRTPDSIGLAWTNPTDPDLARIIVRRAPGATAPATPSAGTAVTLATPTATSVTDTGLGPDTTYSYAVFTRDTTGNTTTPPVTVTTSTRPPPDTTPPPIPSGLHADPGDGTVTVSWDAVSATDLQDYQVFQGPSASGPWTQTTGSPTTNTHLKVGGLTNGTGYWFTIAARDTTGNTSDKATPVSATPTKDTTPPGNVTGLAVTARGDTFIHLAWTNPGDPDLDRIIVRRAQGPDAPTGPTDGTAVPLDTPTATAVDDTGLDKTTRYSYAIFTQDTTGNTTGSPATITVRTRDDNTSICAQPLTGDTTWTPDYRDVYLIDCQYTIPDGITLTIEPGAVLKFTNGANITVQDGGTLVAEGTAQDPVTFTSWRDDTAGGDTNGDGDTTSPAPGDWEGINIDAGGTGSLNQVAIRYPGTGVATLTAKGVSLANTAIRDCVNDAVYVWALEQVDPGGVVARRQHRGRLRAHQRGVLRQRSENSGRGYPHPSHQ